MIRLFGATNETDIINELRALDKICTKAHPNVIEVFQHNWLLPQSMYYIDMELCDLNLSSYISFIPHGWPDALVNKSQYFPSTGYDLAIVWAIMKDIAQGMSFIHGLELVHRDIKPQNGCRRVFLC